MKHKIFVSGILGLIIYFFENNKLLLYSSIAIISFALIIVIYFYYRKSKPINENLKQETLNKAIEKVLKYKKDPIALCEKLADIDEIDLEQDGNSHRDDPDYHHYSYIYIILKFFKNEPTPLRERTYNEHILL